MEITVYQTDANGVFMYAAPAYSPDAAPEEFNIPWGAYRDEPPEPPPGQWPVRVGGEEGMWECRPDYRGVPLFDTTNGAESEGDFVGPLPAGLTDRPRPTTFHAWIDGAWVLNVAAHLAAARASKAAEIDRAFETAAAELTSAYPPTERLTWPMQQAEAQAWAADSNAATPFLDDLAAHRGIAVEDMRQRTLDQVNLFVLASGQLVGTRQALVAQVWAAADAAAVAAIAWPSPG